MKNILLALAVITVFFSTYAGPAYPHLITIDQGTRGTLTYRLTGDEFYKRAVTEDQYTIIRNDEGIYMYAIQDANGYLFPGPYIALNEEFRNSEEKLFLNETPKNLNYSKSILTKKRSRRLKAKGSSGLTPEFPTKGTRRILMLLVEFKDVKFSKTQTDFSNLMNSDSYTENGATGSFKQYYNDVSFGQLNLETDVYGPFTLSENQSYYGANDENDEDERPREMVSEAVQLADATVNFSLYDNDDNGWAEDIYVIFAGYDEAAGGPATSIWAHNWGIQPVKKDGVYVSGYGTSAELSGNFGSQITAIGLICHEYGHALGLPDMYDTDSDESGGESFDLNSWDLMAGGNWNNNGKTPAPPGAWGKIFLQWQYPVDLTSPLHIVLKNASDFNTSFKIRTENPNEYFLIENRQLKDWDTYIPYAGMLVYRINHDLGSWLDNCINCTPDQQGIDLIEADNTQSQFSRRGDVFPGFQNITEISDFTTPSLKLTDGSNSGFKLTNITESGEDIFFDFFNDDYIPEKILCENFFSGNIPSGWTTIDSIGNSQIWTFNDPGNRDISFTSGNNGFAILDSDHYGVDNNQNSMLISPAIDISDRENLTISFETDMWDFDAVFGDLGGVGKFYYTFDKVNYNLINTWNDNTEPVIENFIYLFDNSSETSNNIYFVWHYKGSYAGYWAFDDFCVTKDVPLEIYKNREDVSNIKVYPTLVNQKLTIISPSEQIQSVRIYNLTGSIVYHSEAIFTGESEFDLGHLTPNVYLLEYSTIDTKQVIKIVKY